MQDNLEFLQWTKKHWDQYYPGGDYDALARRKAAGAPASNSTRGPGTTSATGARRGGTTPVNSAGGRPRLAGGAGSANSAALMSEINAQKEAIAGLEKERDFYFAKLRDIELLLQQAVEADPELDKDDDSLVKHIQAILYSTEVCRVWLPVLFPFLSFPLSSQSYFPLLGFLICFVGFRVCLVFHILFHRSFFAI